MCICTPYTLELAFPGKARTTRCNFASATQQVSTECAWVTDQPTFQPNGSHPSPHVIPRKDKRIEGPSTFP